MQVKQAFRFELDPNQKARMALAKHIGAARFAYNWGLARLKEALEQGRLPPPPSSYTRSGTAGRGKTPPGG